MNEELKDIYQRAIENDHNRVIWLTESYATSPKKAVAVMNKEVEE